MLTKELKRIIRKNWRAMRPSYYRNFHGHYDLHVRINARVILADTIQHYAENDIIGAVIDRTDCDMYEFRPTGACTILFVNWNV